MEAVIQAYVDGSCEPNPGRGGWAALLRYPDATECVLMGSEPVTTNNRMELTAALQALFAIPVDTEILVVSDSRYVVEGVTSWIYRWQMRAFRGVNNVDLWRGLKAATDKRRVQWQWIRGHNGHPMNERVDLLARRACKMQTPSTVNRLEPACLWTDAAGGQCHRPEHHHGPHQVNGRSWS